MGRPVQVAPGTCCLVSSLAVEIQQRNGVQRLPIADVMLRTNLALVLAALASIALSWWWQHLFARRRQ